MFICRRCLNMYFSPKKVFCLIYWILFWHMNSTCLLSVTGEQKPPWQWCKDTLHFHWKRVIKPDKCFWHKPSHSSSLIDCYNAIYVTLDKIQTRTTVYPHKPNHYVYDSFFLYFLFLCFKLKKKCSMTVLHNFCLRKRNGLGLRLGKTGL